MKNPLAQLETLEKHLDKLAPKRTTQLKGDRFKSMHLLDFVPAITPRYQAPSHLMPIVRVLQAIKNGRENLHFSFSCPPRHGKTELLAHFAALILIKDPSKKIIYSSYADRLAKRFSRTVRRLCEEAGVQISRTLHSQDHWETTAGGGMLAAGIGSGITGFGCDLLIVDDIHKDRREAESGLVRESIIDWFRSVAFTRLNPGGSCIVVATRWHPEDLIGTLTSEGWKHIRLPAINSDGKALWEAVRPLKGLLKIQETLGAYDWSSLYQGLPVPKGGRVFKADYQYYSQLPTEAFRLAIGADFAYSAKTKADFSVAVTMMEANGLYYLVDVKREQVEAPIFGATLKALSEANGASKVHAYIFGSEKGVTDFLKSNHGVRLDAKPAKGDKFTRAQPLAAAWNAGKILLPKSAPWLNAFLSEVLGFTGINDRHDDQVDALASAFDALAKKRNPRGMLTFG